MAFSPFARFRNFTLDNLKALLDVYPDMMNKMSWSEASDIIEEKSKGYKKTAYQQACQFGLEDRGMDTFRVQSYLYSFDDENLMKYIKFWLKTYYAPNPYVNSDDAPMLIYCELAKDILASNSKQVDFYQFFNEKIGGKSDDILLNALKAYAAPLKYKKVDDKHFFYVDESDIQMLTHEISLIEEKFPIGDAKSRMEFFNRFTYDKFCDFYGISCVISGDEAPSNETKEINFKTGYVSEFARNRIMFGAPGTGKSYTLNKERKELLFKNESDYERVTFHPNYSYANFVGTYKPISSKDSNGTDTIKYKYVPGPFMRIYVKALQNSKNQNAIKPFLLLIEEINRANVAAVFGDIFQLLDRDENNVSEYTIQATEDVKKYLAEELECAVEEITEIRIPDNMFIWATMNSADQGVFPMDTAFKRRWEFEYIGVDDEAKEVEKYIIPIGDKEHRKYVKWNDLRVRVNDILVSDECKVNENKLLGPFFISKNMLESACENEERFIKAFESKVIMYLFEDAMKMRPKNIFKKHEGKMTFSAICKTFEEKGEGLFGISDIEYIEKEEQE